MNNKHKIQMFKIKDIGIKVMELLKLVIIDDEPILLEGLLLKTYDWGRDGV